MKVRKGWLLILACVLLAAGGCGKKEEAVYGISFTNDVYDNPDMPPDTHHTEDTYRQLSEMGMNTVRFYLNYGLFEDDGRPFEYQESGFEWIDRNIKWAKKYGIRLILNMHYPQGGYQTDGKGTALWKSEDNRRRFTALWGEIAARYAGESAILGYGLLNEPVVPAQATFEQTVSQWAGLAQETADTIRTRDQKHWIYVERIQGVTGMEQADWTYDYRDPANFVELLDEHYTWEFHYYNPIELTHQGIDWYGSRDGFYYPGSGSGRSSSPVWLLGEELSAERDEKRGVWSCRIDSSRLQGGNLANLTSETPVSRITVTEYDESGRKVRTYFEGMDFSDDWEAAAEGWNFQVLTGCSYQILWEGDGRLRADYFDGQYTGVWNRASLEEELNYYLSIGKEKGIPMYLGETGTSAGSLKNGLGGEIWLRDVLEIAQAGGAGITVHCLHEAGGFGLYTDPAGVLPVTLNREMYEILRRP